ncbi:AzlC family ABC transporter permease [Halalkalibacillus halophilus]|uniref:AzlC family ABC transporter permease n=1 Tax=Halalkalibacillus halophilus TaxID=392827 RepID=UPI0004172082|nr:AzlC family ABC transporter permease [Halalkalibacillus halophilus]
MGHTEAQSINSQSRKQAIKNGAVAGFPIFLGYMPISIAYGVLAQRSGLTIFETTMMSLLVFAGAAQFMATNMIAQGAAAIQIVIATFVLNFRHFVMSMSFINRIRSFTMRWKFGLSLGLTDETFAVSSLHGEEAKKNYGRYFYLSLILVAYFSWVFGSFIGAIIGDTLPRALSESMGIALYAMFIGLLVPSVKKQWRLGLIAGSSMLLNVLLVEWVQLEQGWSIVLATVFGSLLGIPLLKEEDV